MKRKENKKKERRQLLSKTLKWPLQRRKNKFNKIEYTWRKNIMSGFFNFQHNFFLPFAADTHRSMVFFSKGKVCYFRSISGFFVLEFELKFIWNGLNHENVERHNKQRENGDYESKWFLNRLSFILFCVFVMFPFYRCWYFVNILCDWSFA